MSLEALVPALRSGFRYETIRDPLKSELGEFIVAVQRDHLTGARIVLPELVEDAAGNVQDPKLIEVERTAESLPGFTLHASIAAAYLDPSLTEEYASPTSVSSRYPALCEQLNAFLGRDSAEDPLRYLLGDAYESGYLSFAAWSFSGTMGVLTGLFGRADQLARVSMVISRLDDKKMN